MSSSSSAGARRAPGRAARWQRNEGVHVCTSRGIINATGGRIWHRLFLILGMLMIPPERTHQSARGAAPAARARGGGRKRGENGGATPRPPARRHNEGRGGCYHCTPPQPQPPRKRASLDAPCGIDARVCPRKNRTRLGGLRIFFGGRLAPLQLCCMMSAARCRRAPS